MATRKCTVEDAVSQLSRGLVALAPLESILGPGPLHPTRRNRVAEDRYADAISIWANYP